MTLPTRSAIHPVRCLALLAGCTSDPLAGTTDANPSTTTSTTDTPTTSSTTASTSDSGGPTEACAPDPASIPLEEFSQRFAEALCEQKAACGCDGGFACVGTFQMDFDPLVAYAAEQALQYDAECAATMLFNAITARGCTNASAEFEFPCEFCYPFQGDVTEGEACQNPPDFGFILFSNPCTDPSHCLSGTCKDLDKAPLQIGDMCWLDDEGFLGRCEDSWCDVLDSNTCIPFAAEGEDCSGAVSCELDTFCNEMSRCELRRPPGKPCTSDSQCNTFRCSEGSCEDFILICDIDDLEDFL